ncbi:MAG: hypothetical protein NTY38_29340 [Acidobacteria bacterium]|nr:hypothetical protein [Acidobacteriota bacterium]
MRTFALLSVTACLASALAQPLPDAGEVIGRYVRALGGREALLAVNSRVARGVIECPTFGGWGEYAEQSRRPDHFARGYRMERYGVVRKEFDGTKGLIESPEYAVEELSGKRLAELRREAQFDWPLKLKELYPGLAVRGRARMFEQDTVELVSNLPEGGQARLFFSVESGLLVCVIAPETAREGISRAVETWYEDYRPVEGVQLAHTVRIASDELILIVRRTFVKP